MNKDDLINDVLTRGVEDIFVKENLETKLRSDKKLRIKLGIDPTGNTIHLGRASVLRKLKKFQALGHQIVLIVGDFTALIGDSSDKSEKRPMLNEKQVKENLKNYIQIVGKIIDIDKSEIVFNSSWLSKLNFKDIAELAESFSVQQMLARRNFSERYEKGQDISLREFLYPIMQGYDSVAIQADVEIGGFDQLFNVKAGRIIQKHYGMETQDVLTCSMLEGTDGRKMSTSWGNVVNITDEPNDMFGKIMSVKDELITKYFLLCTDVSVENIESIEKELKGGKNPKEVKLELAKNIVSLYHGEELAQKAVENFEKTFSKKETPDDLPELAVVKGEELMEVVLKNKVLSSKSEFKRLIDEGAVSILPEGNKIEDFHFKLEKDLVIKLGKHKFLNIKIS